jgi:COP9 signalosome complex subunit 6
MLHDRIQVLVAYVTSVIAGSVLPPSRNTMLNVDLGNVSEDYSTLRSLSALLASLPAADQPEFRQEFDTVKFPFCH